MFVVTIGKKQLRKFATIFPEVFMLWAISGDTFPLRHDLFIIGCKWTGRIWICHFENVKEKLEKLGTPQLSIQKIKIEKVLDKENLEIILKSSG